MTTQAPTELRLRRKERALHITWADGEVQVLPCELLRAYSPSAEVRGHGEGQRIVQTGKKYVGISKLEPVGNYAVRISFDDGHDSGIYSWDHLRDLGDNQDKWWQRYLRELDQAGASRLPDSAVGAWQPVRMMEPTAKSTAVQSADPKQTQDKP